MLIILCKILESGGIKWKIIATFVASVKVETYDNIHRRIFSEIGR
jgi:hypothetical protein